MGDLRILEVGIKKIWVGGLGYQVLGHWEIGVIRGIWGRGTNGLGFGGFGY